MPRRDRNPLSYGSKTVSVRAARKKGGGEGEEGKNGRREEGRREEGRRGRRRRKKGRREEGRRGRRRRE
jgi:hypothetical protein